MRTRLSPAAHLLAGRFGEAGASRTGFAREWRLWASVRRSWSLSLVSATSGSPRCCGSVSDVDDLCRVAFVDSVKADRVASGVVVEPDALAEQDRCHVQVDFVDQPEFEELTADRRREHFEVLAASRLQS